jgi:lantibiotic modifying enzyme
LICGTFESPYIGWRTKSKGQYFNLPILNDEKEPPLKYWKDIEEGFNQTAKKIISEKDKISQTLAKLDGTIRVIIRPTRMYRLLILKSCYPQIYTKQKEENFLETSLKGYGYIYKFENHNLFANEIDAMKDSQIPVFYSGLKSKEIVAPTGDVVAMWKNTPYEIWNKYMQDFDISFLDEQLEIIRGSIA